MATSGCWRTVIYYTPSHGYKWTASDSSYLPRMVGWLHAPLRTFSIHTSPIHTADGSTSLPLAPPYTTIHSSPHLAEVWACRGEGPPSCAWVAAHSHSMLSRPFLHPCVWNTSSTFKGRLQRYPHITAGRFVSLVLLTPHTLMHHHTLSVCP